MCFFGVLRAFVGGRSLVRVAGFALCAVSCSLFVVHCLLCFICWLLYVVCCVCCLLS